MKKTTVYEGERISRGATIRLGCIASIFDASGTRILLTRRADNGQWCLPGGGIDSGESAAEACVREIREETGLEVEVRRLIGVYSSPHVLVEYPDGNRVQIVALNFAVNVTGGRLGLSDETTGADYFTLEETAQMDVIPHHRERIADAFNIQPETYIR